MGLIKVEMRQKKPDYLFFLKHFIQNHLFIPIQQETNVPFAQPNLTTEKKRFFIKGWFVQENIYPCLIFNYGSMQLKTSSYYSFIINQCSDNSHNPFKWQLSFETLSKIIPKICFLTFQHGFLIGNSRHFFFNFYPSFTFSGVMFSSRKDWASSLGEIKCVNVIRWN